MTSLGLDLGTPRNNSVINCLSSSGTGFSILLFKNKDDSNFLKWFQRCPKHPSYWASHDIAQIFPGCKLFYYIHKGFITFATLRQCSNSHILVHGLLYQHHLVCLIRFLDLSVEVLKIERATGKSFNKCLCVYL